MNSKILFFVSEINGQPDSESFHTSAERPPAPMLSQPLPDFRLLFESAPGLYLVLRADDPVFTIVAVSDAYLSATMTRREEILGRGVFDVFPDNPSDPEATGVRNLLSSLRRVAANGGTDALAVQKYDVRRREAEGSAFEMRYWSALNSAVPAEPGGRTAYIIHQVQDVTEFVRLRESQRNQERVAPDLRRHTEKIEAEVFELAQQVQEANQLLRASNEELAGLRMQESAAALQALESSERRYRTLVSATSSIVWTRDPQGAFVAPQPSWSAYTGQSWDQYKGWGWLDALHPDDRERVAARWRAVADSREIFEVEARIWSVSANRYRRFVGRGAPVMSSEGAVEEWIGTVTDIDDQRRLEEQLRHTAKLESLGILAGGIAHDFNNLLTGILGNATQAVEIFKAGEPGGITVLQNIVEAGERAAHLTRQMLAYSGKGSFLLRQVDLSSLVREISTLLQSSVSKKVYLRLELQRDLPAIEADPGQIQQIVMNLIINGAEAVDEGADGTVLVTTASQFVDEEYARNFDSTYSLKPGLFVSLEVHDSGCGMSEETRRKIFDPFFTTKVHGRGLGLSAVLGIVRGHHGALRVYSEPGKGTTFKVLFPATGERAAPAPVVTSSLQAKIGTGSILVIDDEDLVRRTVKSCLQRCGYTVTLAPDGASGIQHFRRNATGFDLVILDLMMPGMSGEETLRHLRTTRPDIPVILSSGYNQVEATRKFVGKGLAAFLQKPFTIHELVTAVRVALEG